jgi:outer membrane protein OmpA-like peptidoglycan-associated protein
MQNFQKYFIPFSIFFFASFHLTAQAYKVERLGGGINTPYAEISPVLTRDAKTLYFTRIGSPDFERTLIEEDGNLDTLLKGSEYMNYLQLVYSEIAGYPVSNPVSSSFNQDIWITTQKDNTFSQPYHPGYPLNNALPNSVCSITPFDQTLVLINQFPEKGGMKKGYSLTQRLADSSWSFPSPITIEKYYNLQKEVNMTMSIDGSVIIFSMRRENSYGESDLYVSFRKEKNTWGGPINLGPQVNTSFSETTPFLSDDTRTLYFASDRKGAAGQRDIFVVNREDDSWQKWGKPRRFIRPINSDSDDSHPCFNPATGMLYFSSKRDGSHDLYRVKIAVPNPITVTVKGKVLERNSLKPMGARIVSGPAENQQIRNTFISEGGNFRIDIPKGDKIRIVAERAGYVCEPIEFFFKHSYYYFKEYEITLFLDPLEEGMTVVLPTIYFEQSLPLIKPESYGVLNELALFLTDNPRVHIRIEGHTDNLGDPEALQQLSEQRADAIKEYLVDKGIEEGRLTTAGFGASRPVNDNSTDELRQQNRRVEIVITKSK